MEVRRNGHTPLRGKIIKKVELSASSSRAQTSAHPMTRKRIWGAWSAATLAPFVFLASAAFMWTRPVSEASTPTSHHSVSSQRFKELGAQYKRLSKVEGVPIAVPTPKVISLPPVQLLEGLVGPSRSQPSVPSSDVLERKVLKILERYGRPVQNGSDLAKAIVKEARVQNYDPLFVAAVIKSESAFNSLARSNKGAQGLMQIMPKTGAWLADQVAVPRGRLTDPGHNLKLGITYLKQLEAEYGGNRVLTLIAYNWGPGRVESASSGRRRVPTDVMKYAVKILNDYRRWHSEIG